MLEIARTPARLFRQMRAQGRALPELELVRHAYDFAAPLHSGRFEVDGTPFQAHGLGVASVVGQLGAPAHVIGAATLHNSYTTGDWGDSRERGPSPRRRARMRDALGEDVETCVYRVHTARASGLLSDALAGRDDFDDDERWVVLLELGDLIDKWEDGRVNYSEPGRGDRQLVDGREEAVVDLARRVGGPALSGSFVEAFALVAAEEIPDSLRLGRTWSEVVPPGSWRQRPSITARRLTRRSVARVRRRVQRGR